MTQMNQGTTKIINTLILGSAVIFVIAVVLATIVFDKVSPGTNRPSQDVEMGVQMDLVEHHIEAFVDAILYLNIKMDIIAINKVGKDGTDLGGGSVSDLFPVQGPARGRIVVEFRIKVISKTEMPQLKRNRKLIPLAYVLETQFSEYRKSGMKFAVFGMKLAGGIAGLGIFGALFCILLGVALIQTDSQNEKKYGNVGGDNRSPISKFVSRMVNWTLGKVKYTVRP